MAGVALATVAATLLLLCEHRCTASTVVTYPDPGSDFVDDKYSVRVRDDSDKPTNWSIAPTYTTYAPASGPEGTAPQQVS